MTTAALPALLMAVGLVASHHVGGALGLLGGALRTRRVASGRPGASVAHHVLDRLPDLARRASRSLPGRPT